MRLDEQTRELLAASRIGLLALNTGKLPLVNPAAFHLSGESLFMTTSRHAVKVMLARRDPRAAFLVHQGEKAVHLEGTVEVYDPRSLTGQVRAALDGPRFYFGLAGYALKNAAFGAGYLMDLASIPFNYWPHNRVVLRLQVTAAQRLRMTRISGPRPAAVEGAPLVVSKALGRQPVAYACWLDDGSPQLAPCLWAADGPDGLVWLPAGISGPPRADAAGALVIEKHHAFRATRMVGACVRGTFRSDADATAIIENRYDTELEGGEALRLKARRVTWWRGFEVRTEVVKRGSRIAK